MTEETFKFGFNNDEDDNAESNHPDVPRAPAEEITLGAVDPAAPDPTADEQCTIKDDFWLYKGRVTGEQAASLLADDRVSGSDLIPGVYEGGFKLWEGSVDLCQFLVGKFKLRDVFSSGEATGELHGKAVLELGCGHGLPGIVALLAGAAVHFQDYNSPVLRSLTIPAVKANLRRLPPGRSRPPTRFFSGDWSCVADFLTCKGFGGHYDFILTSETLYSLESQIRLLESIKQLLQPPHGIVYVASKSYYFGVGGGTASFEQLVKDDGIFECRPVFQVGEEGEGSVKRVVLELKFPDSIMPYFL